MSMATAAETDPAPFEDAMVPVPARVTGRTEEAPGVVTLTLEAPPDWAGFVPGQFNMLGLMGVGEVPISFSGDPADAGRIVHTIRAAGPVSSALAALEPGAWLMLRGPYGKGWPIDLSEGRDVIVAAGGLGLAPLRPTLYTLLAGGGRFGRVTLLYGTRSPGDILYGAEHDRWRAGMAVHVTVDHAEPGWRGNVGVVTKLFDRAEFDPARTTAFICGPEVMMRFAATGLVDRGTEPASVFVSMERNMACGIGLCGHCQLGPHFICRDGPVFDWREMRPAMAVKEL
ncbi:FAD/NAD(P)-binding protein [Ostreiculturibacter nitratireducens]|uniref:FAD/NAD(P)-binding protein n=1 Tax=Ostreiculturibacter nitratireducens TaxID=3075226 RepID=UPI0031B5A9E5